MTKTTTTPKLPKVVKPLGKMSPWVWSVELVRGCNLACWHCTARIFPADHKPMFMAVSDWVEMCKVIDQATPGVRLEVAQGGEPTLHPDLLKLLRLAKQITPRTQRQVTTNGVTLLRGQITHKELFDAGANVVYVDMYAPEERHIALAKESGAEWYLYNKPKVGTPGHRMANTYYDDPSMRLLILQDNPHNRLKWRHEGRLSTFLNTIDFKAAMPYGLVPVREPYQRKCTLPQRYVSLSVTGEYLFCCIDFKCESAGLMGSVREGVEGFKKYWMGRMMQTIRRELQTGDRKNVPYCSRCNCAFSKCDWTGIWPKGATDRQWDGAAWSALPPKERNIEVFADGWEKTRAVQASLPSVEEEAEVLRTSDRRVIRSTAAVDRDRKKKAALPALPVVEREDREPGGCCSEPGACGCGSRTAAGSALPVLPGAAPPGK